MDVSACTGKWECACLSDVCGWVRVCALERVSVLEQ